LKSELSDRDEQIMKLNEQLNTSSNRLSQIMDHETQTDEQQQDKSVQINNKLKRALQTIKEKVHRIVTEKPELFPQMSDDTIERIEQLVSTFGNQAEQIEILQNERDQFQKNLSEKDEEQTLLQKRLDDVQLEFRKTIESLQQERNALVEQQTVQSSES
jgi:predicted  nucleic acid-binding Zn-ribbon protein